jgi:hypothetical protein
MRITIYSIIECMHTRAATDPLRALHMGLVEYTERQA